MLSRKVLNYLSKNGWWFNDPYEDYKKEMIKLGIKEESDIMKFYIHAEDGPYFSGKKWDIIHLGWFAINTDYTFSTDSLQRNLELPKSYIPLDSFEAEAGFFYNRETEEVIELHLDGSLKQFKSGKLKPQWRNFNAFLEWYFDL